MEFSQWVGIAVLCTMGAMSPGLSFAVIVQTTMQYGRRYGVIAAWAHGCAIGIYAVLTVVGLSVVLVNYDWLYQTLRWLGIAFLLYLAIQLLRAGSEPSAIDSADLAQTHRGDKLKSMQRGFLIVFLNPKVAVFFIALFSQYIESHFTGTDKSVIVATAAGIDALWYSLVALGFSQARVLRAFKKYQLMFNRMFSAVLFVMAITFAIFH